MDFETFVNNIKNESTINVSIDISGLYFSYIVHNIESIIRDDGISINDSNNEVVLNSNPDSIDYDDEDSCYILEYNGGSVECAIKPV